MTDQSTEAVFQDKYKWTHDVETNGHTFSSYLSPKYLSFGPGSGGIVLALNDGPLTRGNTVGLVGVSDEVVPIRFEIWGGNF